MKVTKQAKEAQLQQIFRMLLESRTQESIANQLGVNMRTVQRYTQDIDERYGQMQRQKTDNTIFTECQLFKNRMLTLYKILESKATDLKTNGSEAAKCCEVAANIAIDVLKMESEGIRAVKDLGVTYYEKRKGNKLLGDIQREQEREQEQSTAGGGERERQEQPATTINHMVPRTMDDPEETTEVS